MSAAVMREFGQGAGGAVRAAHLRAVEMPISLQMMESIT